MRIFQKLKSLADSRKKLVQIGASMLFGGLSIMGTIALLYWNNPPAPDSLSEVFLFGYVMVIAGFTVLFLVVRKPISDAIDKVFLKWMGFN